MTHPKALSTEIGMILQKRDAIDSAAVSSVQADKSWKAEFGPPLHSPWGSSDFLNIHSYQELRNRMMPRLKYHGTEKVWLSLIRLPTREERSPETKHLNNCGDYSVCFPSPSLHHWERKKSVFWKQCNRLQGASPLRNSNVSQTLASLTCKTLLTFQSSLSKFLFLCHPGLCSYRGCLIPLRPEHPEPAVQLT